MHTPRGGWGDCQHNVHVCAANKCGGYSNKVCPELEVEEEEPASASEEPAAADSNCIDDFDAKYGAGYCAKRVHPGVWPLSDPPPHTVRDTELYPSAQRPPARMPCHFFQAIFVHDDTPIVFDSVKASATARRRTTTRSSSASSLSSWHRQQETDRMLL